MEYLVVYSVWELDRSIELGQTKVMVEFDERQVKRVKRCIREKKTNTLDSNYTIHDIYKMIYDIAIEIEQTKDYGPLVGKTVFPVEFMYPEKMIEEVHDELKFLKWCEEPHQYENYIEYSDLVFKWLTMCKWNYSEEVAVEIMKNHSEYIYTAYENGETVANVGGDIGRERMNRSE